MRALIRHCMLAVLAVPLAACMADLDETGNSSAETATNTLAPMTGSAETELDEGGALPEQSGYYMYVCWVNGAGAWTGPWASLADAQEVERGYALDDDIKSWSRPTYFFAHPGGAPFACVQP